MTAFTDSIGFNKGTAAYPAKGGDRLSFYEVELDFEAIVAARSAAGATALAAADTLQVIALPANSVVLHAGMQVVTAESTNTTCTFDLGFTGGSPESAAYYGDDKASSTAAMLQIKQANAAIIGTSADFIDLLINTAAPTNCVLRVFAFVLNPN